MLAEIVKRKGRPENAVLESFTREAFVPAKQASSQQKSTTADATTLTPNFIRDGDGLLGANKSNQEAQVLSSNKGLWQSPPTAPAVHSTFQFAKLTKSTPATRTTSASYSSSWEAKTPNSKILYEVSASLSETKGAPDLGTAKLKSSSPASTPLTSTTIESQLGSKPALNDIGKVVKSTGPPQTKTRHFIKPASASKNKSIPVAGLDPTIVSRIGSRDNARPGTKALESLPTNYKSTARKVTGVFIAIPILIVTSYVLYQRLVLGEERKRLDQSSIATVDNNA